MTFFLQQLVQGLALGSIYGLIAIGYVLIYNTWGVLNFAQGDMVMVGAFTALIAYTYIGLPMWLAIPTAVLMCIVIGYLIELCAFRPLINAENQRRLIATIGVGIFLRNLIQIIFGADAFAFPSIFGNKAIDIGGLMIVPQDIWNTVIGILLVVLLMLFLKKTRIGKAMRATAQDREAARLMGVNVRQCMSLTFVLSSAIGGFAGILLSPKYFVIASLGLTFGNKGFAAALFGGIASNAGSMVGGITLGVLESLAATYGSSTWQTAIAFLILFLTLIVKPSGIMGKKDIRKV